MQRVLATSQTESEWKTNLEVFALQMDVQTSERSCQGAIRYIFYYGMYCTDKKATTAIRI